MHTPPLIPVHDPAETSWHALVHFLRLAKDPAYEHDHCIQALSRAIRSEEDDLHRDLLTAAIKEWSARHTSIPVKTVSLVDALLAHYGPAWFHRQTIHRMLDEAYLPSADAHALEGLRQDVLRLCRSFHWSRTPLCVPVGAKLELRCPLSDLFSSSAPVALTYPWEGIIVSLVHWLHCVLGQGNPHIPYTPPPLQELLNSTRRVVGRDWEFGSYKLRFHQNGVLKVTFQSSGLAQHVATLLNTDPEIPEVVWTFPSPSDLHA